MDKGHRQGMEALGYVPKGKVYDKPNDDRGGKAQHRYLFRR